MALDRNSEYGSYHRDGDAAAGPSGATGASHPRIEVLPDGRSASLRPALDEYVEGRVISVRVDAVQKSDGRLAPGATVLLYWQSIHVGLVSGQQYLFFLRTPIALLGRPADVPSWEELSGTTYREPVTGQEALLSQAA